MLCIKINPLLDFFLYCAIIKLGDNMQQYYEILIKYSSLRDKTGPLSMEDNQFLLGVNNLASTDSNLKTMISFLERENNPVLRKKVIDINAASKKLKETNLSKDDFDIENVNGERVIIVHEKEPLRRNQILAQVQGIEQYYLYPELLERLSPYEREKCNNLLNLYKSKIKEPEKVLEKVKPSNKIAGYIDALMIGWFTGLTGSIIFSIMLYILSK